MKNSKFYYKNKLFFKRFILLKINCIIKVFIIINNGDNTIYIYSTNMPVIILNV